jgi:hypothetical protein
MHQPRKDQAERATTAMPVHRSGDERRDGKAERVI